SGAERSTGDDSHFGSVRVLPVEEGVVGTAGASALGGEGDEHSCIRGRARLDGGAADEVAFLLQGYDPAKASLHGEDLRAQLVAIQRHARLKSEGVSAGQASRNQTVVCARRP